MSIMVSLLYCPFFPRDILDEILDLIESVSEVFPTYSYTLIDTRENIIRLGGSCGEQGLISQDHKTRKV